MSAEFLSLDYAEVNMFDRWYDSIEGQVDRFMSVAENVLFYATIAGVIALVIVQGIKAID